MTQSAVHYECECYKCERRRRAEMYDAERGRPDPGTDDLTLTLAKALRLPMEKAEGIAMVLMEAMRREAAHVVTEHESDFHPYRD